MRKYTFIHRARSSHEPAIYIRLKKETIDKLKTLAEKRQSNVSAVAREIIEGATWSVEIDDNCVNAQNNRKSPLGVKRTETVD